MDGIPDLRRKRRCQHGVLSDLTEFGCLAASAPAAVHAARIRGALRHITTYAALAANLPAKQLFVALGDIRRHTERVEADLRGLQTESRR
jgi:hypothetical protein